MDCVKVGAAGTCTCPPSPFVVGPDERYLGIVLGTLLAPVFIVIFALAS